MLHLEAIRKLYNPWHVPTRQGTSRSLHVAADLIDSWRASIVGHSIHGCVHVAIHIAIHVCIHVPVHISVHTAVHVASQVLVRH